jgi:non-heme chloroperoxidase
MLINTEKYFIASDSQRIGYFDEGQGQPIVFLNGWRGGDYRRTQPLVDVFQSKYRCIGYDYRGYGFSPTTGEISVQLAAGDAKELLEYLGIDNAILFGISMGGAVLYSFIQQFGCQYCRGFVIADMPPKTLNDDTWNLGLYQGCYKKEHLQRDLEMMLHQESFAKFGLNFCAQIITPHQPGTPHIEKFDPVTEQKARELVAMMQLDETMAPMMRYANREYWASVYACDFRLVIPHISAPTLLIFPDPGSIYSVKVGQWLHSQIRDSKLVIPEGTGIGTHLAILDPVVDEAFVSEFFCL